MDKCNAQASKGQDCKNCNWFQPDYEWTGFNGEYGYYCFAKPDIHGNVKWEQATCTNK